MRRILTLLFLTAAVVAAQGQSQGKGKGKQAGSTASGTAATVSVVFSSGDRATIQQWIQGMPPANLPPGLAKRGDLPPGLQKQLQKNGQLPPGLQKRVEPLPVELSRQLPPLPEHWERVVVERDVILLDRRTNRILDIIEDVIALVTGS